MQYGFVINQDTCIGCHACTVACKAENDVPVGGFRTNVKYVEVGKFPRVKRSFLVQRCNHCTDAPCVTICPVNALSKRPDGIVDIDRDACIGCRACMQACPYDALYLNEDLGAVEKCHFCAHRIEKGLEPACVTVCPVHAIIPGDFHDPESEVSLLKRAQDLKARRPEQGTGPNVLYIGASEVALKPGSADKPRSYIWSQRRNLRPEAWPTEVGTEPDAREVLNADHKVEWGWPVALYLLTKGIAAGAAMIAPFLGRFGPSSVPWWAPETIALVFTLITVFLLIEDLKKPLHFYKLFTRPNWNSWLVKGGIVLTVFGGLSALTILIGLIGPISLIQPLRWANALVGALVAGYTAFLFKQCKGRDLWEADGLLWHLLAQSVTAGAAFFLLIGMGNQVTAGAFLLGAVGLAVLGLIPHHVRDATDNYKQAVGFLHQAKVGIHTLAGSGQRLYFAFAGLSYVALYFPDSDLRWIWQGLMAVLSLYVLFLYERAFVRAGQLPPLS
ncbi:MAG: polysulfide reductase NrfD [Fimbriimonadaceae bacterium]|nr:polysulfide reductase NrfD [Fimbriimonadaceae bacterium]